MSLIQDKICPKCDTIKSAECFRILKHPSGSTYLQSWCIECHREDGIKRSLERGLKKFGLTIGQYELILKSQNGVCAICGQIDSNRRLAVDHCHDMLVNCGLLCSSCNTGIGLLGHSVERILAAADYVRRTRPWLL